MFARTSRPPLSLSLSLGSLRRVGSNNARGAHKEFDRSADSDITIQLSAYQPRARVRAPLSLAHLPGRDAPRTSSRAFTTLGPLTLSLSRARALVIIVVVVIVARQLCVHRGMCHVTSNRKLGENFQSRSESPFGLAHDGVARSRASEGPRVLIWRRRRALHVIRAANLGETRREGEEEP